MRISREEEHILRRGAKGLDLEIKRYAKEFKSHDNRDMLAMVAFDLMVEKMRREQVKEAQEQDALSRIRRLQDMLMPFKSSDDLKFK